MGIRGCPLPPEGRAWGPAKSPYGGPPTGDTSKAGRDGSITATGNGPTGNAAACGA